MTITIPREPSAHDVLIRFWLKHHSEREWRTWLRLEEWLKTRERPCRKCRTPFRPSTCNKNESECQECRAVRFPALACRHCGQMFQPRNKTSYQCAECRDANVGYHRGKEALRKLQQGGAR